MNSANDNYDAFIATKLARVPPTGLFELPELPPWLFPFQQDLVRWALRRGRCAIFAATGLGKTRMELAWADAVYRVTGQNVLLLAPLAVGAQTAREAASVGVPVTLCREQEDVRPGVNIINYDRIHKIDASGFGAVVLDESSCVKSFNSKTLRVLLESFSHTPFRLCATATPAPNDWTELGTHAEFLGVCTRPEMLAEYFVHDGGDTSVWRLKGHARALFWKWVASWGAMVSHPRDLGDSTPGYDLPPVQITQHTILADAESVKKTGLLFATEAQSLMERKGARRGSIDERVRVCADRVNADDEPWIVWCELNAESEALTRAIHGAVEVRGSDDADAKERALTAFARGEIRVLVTKPSIAGWGLNFQAISRMAFVGVSDSWESYYQAVRRCWRFGQQRQVQVHLYASEMEGAVVANLRRKESDAETMMRALSAETRDAVREQVQGQTRDTIAYAATRAMDLPAWLVTEAA